tara:strand:+ start:3750 stop:5432 length:1683 start_codon:yes stop_codon:yes gene_type:complete
MYNKNTTLFLTLENLKKANFPVFKFKKDDYLKSILDLKRSGIKNGIEWYFGAIKVKEIIIVPTDQSYKYLQNFLVTFCIIFFWKNISIFVDNGRLQRVKFQDMLTSIFNVIYHFYRIWFFKKNVSRVLKKYPVKPKKIPCLNEGDLIYYYKTNYQFGVKAGGSIGHISGVINSLALDFDVKVFSVDTLASINKNIDISILDYENISYTYPFHLNSLALSFHFIAEFEERVSKERPALIYQRLTLFNFSGAYISNKYNVPFVVEYNGSEAWIQSNWGRGLKDNDLAIEIEDYVLKSADLVVTVSDVLEKELLKRGVNKNKIVTYPNCIDPLKYDHLKHKLQRHEVREKLNIGLDSFVLTYVGTFGAWHGVDFLADSIKYLVENYKEILDINKVQFLLIGDGLLGNTVREKLSHERYEKYVKFTGIVPQDITPDYLFISDVFLSPHGQQKGDFIGSPTKIFEYMAYSKPIIASRLGQIDDLFESRIHATELHQENYEINDQSAIIFEPGNMRQFCDSVLSVVGSKKYEIVGKNSYDLVMKKYTWSNHVEKIVNKYVELSECN